MANTAIIELPVSLGEAVDKLTILDIKIEKITDHLKKGECKKEYDALYSRLEDHIRSYTFWVDALRYINLKIWDFQDDLRSKSLPDAVLALHVLDLNDMRFRVKHKINTLCSSSLKEQKGYAKKVGMFVGHMGLGDMINLNGAIRYASLDVDKLYVLCLERNMKNVSTMFEDDQSIVLLPIPNMNWTPVIQSFITCKSHNGDEITKKFISGDWLRPRTTYSALPDDFYTDLRFPVEIKRIFAKFNYPKNQLPIPDTPYVFVHSLSSSTQECKFPITWDIDELFTVDPGKNHYHRGHKWYKTAQEYVDHPMFEYKDVIENAQQVHVTDSSFYCLCCFMNLNASIKNVYERNTGEHLTKYDFT